MDGKQEKERSCCPPDMKYLCKGQMCHGRVWYKKFGRKFAGRLAALFTVQKNDKKPTAEVEILDSPIFSSTPKPVCFQKPLDEDEASVASSSSDSVAVIPPPPPQDVQQEIFDSGYRSNNDGDFSNIVFSSGPVGKTRMDQNYAGKCWKPIPLDIPTLPVCPSKSKPVFFRKPVNEDEEASGSCSSDNVAVIPPPLPQDVQQENVDSGFSQFKFSSGSEEWACMDENWKWNWTCPWPQRENFVSNDPRENADNEDPKWEELKRLRTDDERKRFALEQFGNFEPSDPSRNLTFHGYRRKMLLLKSHNNNSRVIASKDRQRYKVRLDRGRLLPLDSCEVGLKRKACDDLKVESKRLKMDAISSGEFEQKLMAIVTQYKQKAVDSFTRNHSSQNNSSLMCLKRHLRESMGETVSFFNYYQDQNQNDRDGRKEQLDVTEGTEMLYCQSVKFYGLNPEVKCKACSWSQSKTVWHPF